MSLNLSLKKELPLQFWITLITEKGQEILMPFGVCLSTAYTFGDAVQSALKKIQEGKITGEFDQAKDYSVAIKSSFLVEDILKDIDLSVFHKEAEPEFTAKSVYPDPPPLPAEKEINVVPELMEKIATKEIYKRNIADLSAYLKSPEGKWLSDEGWICENVWAK